MQYYVIILLPCAHTTPYEGVWDDTMSFCWVCDIDTGMLPDNESQQGHLLPGEMNHSDFPYWLWITKSHSMCRRQTVWDYYSHCGKMWQTLTILNPWASHSTEGSPGRRQSIVSPGTCTRAGSKNEMLLRSNPSAVMCGSPRRAERRSRLRESEGR